MFRPSAALSMRYAGIGLDKLIADAGPGFGNTVAAASKAIEEKVPVAAEAKIQGTRPHRSSRDPADKKDVITVSYHDEKGTRILSIHAHSDGTWNEYFSRAGRNKSQSGSGTGAAASGERGEDR
ncbi:hypothetical protein FQN49_004798, partial [Arthroderma sp. PD_2]